VLLSKDEVAPVEVGGREGSSPFFLVCDHAGRLIPSALESLGLSDEQLDRHIAWDIGAAAVARRLAGELGATAILQRYSRLVIDCNRPLDAADSIVRRSEMTDVPGNTDLAPSRSEERARAIFWPYHDEIRARLDRRAAEGRSTVLVAMHSFTPVFLDRARQWHAGVLYNRDARLGRQLLRVLRDEGDLVVGDNEPYAAGDLTDYTIVHHGEGRGLLHVEIEIRQDLITDARGQDAWAARLARLLPRALAAHEATESSPVPRPSPGE
jgi:predicted N-formylglutamate amidohydrolase